MSDHYAAGAAIVAKLVEAFPDIRTIVGCATLGQTEVFRQMAPALLVVPDLEHVLPPSGRIPAQFSEQTWLVVVRVRNVQDVQDGNAALAEAGAVVARVLATLQGWQPPAADTPLKRVTAPRVAYSGGDMAVLLAFALPIQTKGNHK